MPQKKGCLGLLLVFQLIVRVVDAIQQSYDHKRTDEFMIPTMLLDEKTNEHIATIRDNDVVILRRMGALLNVNTITNSAGKRDISITEKENDHSHSLRAVVAVIAGVRIRSTGRRPLRLLSRAPGT